MATTLSKLIGVVGFGVAAVLFAALIGRAVVRGELVLSGQQWVFSVFFLVGTLAALARVWMPVVMDACKFVGKDTPFLGQKLWGVSARVPV